MNVLTARASQACLLREKLTLIDAHVEAKTTDGYTLRLVSGLDLLHVPSKPYLDWSPINLSHGQGLIPFSPLACFHVGLQFAIAFTKKEQGQIKNTAYAQAAQVRAIRKKITEIITEHVTKSTLIDLVKIL